MFSKQIKNLAFTQKLKILAIVVVIIAYLNSSLLISFYQSTIVFGNDRDSNTQLKKVYFREECAYNLILMMREKLIKNYNVSMNLYYTPDSFITVPAVYNYIDRCFENENEINQLRRNLPDYLLEAKDMMDSIESENVCNITYLSTDPERASLCEKNLDSLLLKG